jgi:hypothetical protein
MKDESAAFTALFSASSFRLHPSSFQYGGVAKW